MKIMGVEYEVIYTQLAVEHGCILYADRKILIDSTDPPDIQKDSLLHESLHAILYESGLHYQLAESPGLEENLVRAIEGGLKQAGFKFDLATDRE